MRVFKSLPLKQYRSEPQLRAMSLCTYLVLTLRTGAGWVTRQAGSKMAFTSVTRALFKMQASDAVDDRWVVGRYRDMKHPRNKKHYVRKEKTQFLCDDLIALELSLPLPIVLFFFFLMIKKILFFFFYWI